MNRNGNITNLIASHPGNRNATKSGVNSERSRSERKDQLFEELRSRPLNEILSEMLVNDLCSVRALGELLDADIAQNGVTNRRGESRRQVGQRLRVLRQVHELRTAIQFELERRSSQSSDTGKARGVDDYEAAVERYSEMRAIALGERSDASVAAQIRAIKSLLEMRRPRAPNPASALSDEELNALVRADDDTAATDHGAAEPTEHDPSDNDRCREVLRRIGNGTRLDARASDRIAAIELLNEMAPAAPDFIREDVASMTPTELQASVRELATWFETFEAENPELAHLNSTKVDE